MQVPNTNHVAVLHMPSASSTGSGTAADSSPLLLLKDNRHYSFALLDGCALQGSSATMTDAAATAAGSGVASGPGLAAVQQGQEQEQQQQADATALITAVAAVASAEDEGAFEAAFGSLSALRKRLQAQSAVLAADAMDVDSNAGGHASSSSLHGGVIGGQGVKGAAPSWAPLFDVPSHALPPPTLLAQAFLTMLTTAE